MERAKESQKKKGKEMAVTKATWEDEMAKVKAKNVELKG